MQAQDINVHFLIGKKQSEVIKKYGSPAHRDDSNPDMICMFYKTKLNTMIFVSNKDGVYQSEASKTYDAQTDAMKELDACIAGSVSNGFKVDSVTTLDFRLRKKGVKADLQLSENKLSNKFEIRVKANKTED
jgi:fructose-1-phosphate kinase PfkB-like protein